MDALVLSSTLVLTVLLLIGLFFFVRASVKDRTETYRVTTPIPAAALLDQVQTYLQNRAYQLKAWDDQTDQVIFEGIVAPSRFLAVFLVSIVGVALWCLSLVLMTLIPSVGYGWYSLVALSPLAGWFYWQQARRPEVVCLKVATGSSTDQEAQAGFQFKMQTILTVTAHRDEFIAMQASFKETWLELPHSC
ncbi:cofactor assembly of complex C subunit B [Synechococcales cyanobacterium C]|uniref:Cofactor assembly of complex C subunit B n=1 Tax=Petrachloros mirabilis ULC683 TaxID=2781853 RepID=A0A8K2A7I4_9CYAN|nr:cofactor assembly of complex C subunit B [Petrachloros mirabilis ULC683]